MSKGELIIQQLEALIDWNTCVAEQIAKITDERSIPITVLALGEYADVVEDVLEETDVNDARLPDIPEGLFELLIEYSSEDEAREFLVQD
jgi:hypothetical protein